MKLFLFFFIILCSCAHQNKKNQVRAFPYAAELLEKVQKSSPLRYPSSLSVEELSEKSNRRIYFSTLYHQYLTIGSYLGENKNLKFCPQFHTDKIQTDSYNIPKVSMYQHSHIEQDGMVYFPELVFNENFSFVDYYGSLRHEIEVLCEEGVSDNFYKFDNLINHYAHKNTFHQNPKAMTAVLKIPVFANFYLLKMLQIPQFNQASNEEKSFIELTRTEWFENYIVHASRQRDQFIKNKTVKK